MNTNIVNIKGVSLRWALSKSQNRESGNEMRRIRGMGNGNAGNRGGNAGNQGGN